THPQPDEQRATDDESYKDGPHCHRAIASLLQYGVLQTFPANLNFQLACEGRHRSAKAPYEISTIINKIPADREERDHAYGQEGADHQGIREENKIIGKVQQESVEAKGKNKN